MKKIAFILKFFQNKHFHGGGEKLFYKLIGKFVEDGFLIDIYCSKSDVLQSSGINKIIVIDEHYDHLKPQSMEKFYAKAKNLIEKESYDEIISENITPPIGITFLQGHSLLNRMNKKNFLEKFLYNFRPVKITRMKYQKKWLKQGYKTIYTPSNILKKDIVENFNYPEKKIKVIYPGVDIPLNIVERPLNKPLIFGLSAPGFKIKGGYVFLKALGKLKRKGCDFKAKIIYPKHKKNLIVNFLINHIYKIKENIEFLPFQEDINQFYQSCDCIVMPSLEETFGFVALEAMANKKTCIISENAGASEIIKDKENGFIFKKAKHLANTMKQIINNPEILQKTNINAFKTSQNYSWERFYQEFKTSIEEVK